MTTVLNTSNAKGRRKQLRQTMPEAEIILWSRLKNKQAAGAKFRRQYSVGKYVIDFYCAKKKLAIEIDGESHYQFNALEHDEERQKWIEQFGIRFLRFTNDDVRKNLTGVLDAIEEAVSSVNIQQNNRSDDPSVPMNYDSSGHLPLGRGEKEKTEMFMNK